ncbi:MAG: LysR substrate-binding domain-containing protein [Candidatus Symbiodolus clandestinus]
MKLQHLRAIVEVFKQGLNISLAAKRLHSSQPGISKQIRQLEDELGVQIFERHGKHLIKVTDAGRELLQIATDILGKADNLKVVALEHTHPEQGSLKIAATNNQLRYQLPRMISAFNTQYPQVSLHIHQNLPAPIVEALIKEEVDFTITAVVDSVFDSLLMLPCYHFELVAVVPISHPLATKQPLVLEKLIGYPIITYPISFLGKKVLRDLFGSEPLASQTFFTATDPDLIKSYVRSGLGVGIIAKMAVHSQLDQDLVSLSTSHFLPTITTKIGFMRDKFLRGYMLDFITVFAPHLTKDVIEMALEQPDNEAVEELFTSFQLPLK